jgi:hypothetical protein
MLAKTAIAAAVLSALFVPGLPAGAHAQSGNFTCTSAGGILSCGGSVGRGRGSFPQIIRLQSADPEAEERYSAERQRKWLARCQPEFVQDHYGVSRARYVAAGCDVGKTED